MDASRGFYLNFSRKLIQKGCVKSKMDPAMFVNFEEEPEEYCREPNGVAITHVDDIMSAGGNKFEAEVLDGIKENFKFGSEEEQEFRYVGMHIVKYD